MSKIVQTHTSIKNRTRKALQRGFSNVQIAIGILVTVILLLGALSGYQYIQQAKVNNEVAVLTDLKAATIRYGLIVGAFTAAEPATATLVGMNFFDTGGLHVAGNVVSNQWGGLVTSEPDAASTDSINIQFTKVPYSACREIGSKVLNVVKSIKIGDANAIDKLNANPINAINAACGAAGETTMIYKISR